MVNVFKGNEVIIPGDYVRGEPASMQVFKYVALTVLLSTIIYAQTAEDAIRIVQDEIGFGARALGMGGAYTAVSDDYSAIYWNPAGLALMRRSEFFGEVSHLNYNNNATFYQTVTDESENYTRFRSLGFALTLPTRQGSFVLGFGYNRVKDFDQNLQFSGFNGQSNQLSFEINGQEYLFDKDVLQTERVFDEGGLSQWTMGAGIAVSPRLMAGISGIYWDGKSEYRFSFFQEDVEDIYNQFPGDFDSYLLNRSLDSEYGGWGLKLGAMLELTRAIKIGAAYGIPVKFRVEETYTSSDALKFDNGDIDTFDEPVSKFKYDVKTPFHLDGGISLSTANITLSGSVRYRDWSQTEFDIPEAQLDNPDFKEFLDENLRIKDEYTETLDYRAGGELYLGFLRTMVRGGYTVFPSPLKDAPSSMDKEFITGGLSFLIDRYVSLDVTYIRGSWEQQSEDEFTPGGTLEEITTNKILVGFSYRF